ncbi:Spermine/spermidine synthase [Pleurostoma richardsiae]|uniref:Spermine/spermidine synthase n=1 Tax=Pleurostoma richardsiae TaxID=41990 RepID=A0AA38VXA2_9PEZI|nr:Spermine/spermidine synthase [Pleurostoma richardsiae]
MPPKKTTSSKSKAPKIDPNSSFTPESFEKELQALAAKAKDETWGKFLSEQVSIYLRSAVLLGLAAAFSNVSELSLSPVYGSIPSARWHSKLVMAGLFAGWSSNLHLGRLLPIKLKHLLPLIALYVPTAQYCLFRLSGILTAEWGPLVTEALTLFPLLVVSIACTATYLEGADFSRLPRWLGDSLPGLGSYGFFKLAEAVSGSVIQQFVGRSFFQTRMGMEVTLGASYALLAPSKLLLWTIPALLHTALLNTHVMSPIGVRLLNSTLDSQGWVLLDRRESLTGYISVVDSKEQGFRVMRCDHSLLGGEWTKIKGGIVAEPIYSVFVQLEAVRLVETVQQLPDSEARALVIGMGIGTAPAALIAHGVDTTVVEIDPVVHEFASKYFRLPSNHTAVIEDAVSYAERLASSETPQYDYIIHDVFTGGAEPIALFTLEFLQNLGALLKPDGVIAINYAGDFTLPPPKIVVQTIRQVFPSCRIFREHPRNEEEVERDGRDFTNMVIFCTKSSRELTFREPTDADMLGSRTRKMFLKPEYEVFDSDFTASGVDETAVVKKDQTEELAKYHERSALGHWAIMRVVLPKLVWENW